MGCWQVTSTLAGRVAFMLFRHAASERYPTRTVEHMLAWMLLVWSASLALPGNMMRGPTFECLLAIAPEAWWGWSGVALALMRLVASRNDQW